MTRAVSFPALALLAGLFLTSTTHAYGVEAPPAQTSDAGVKYVIGGVGEDERRAMRSAYPHYKLRVEVAQKGGAYSAGMRLRIASTQGHELLNAYIDGPWLMVDLASGEYLLMAQKNGKEASQKITLTSGVQHEVVFLWPAPKSE